MKKILFLVLMFTVVLFAQNRHFYGKTIVDTLVVKEVRLSGGNSIYLNEGGLEIINVYYEPADSEMVFNIDGNTPLLLKNEGAKFERGFSGGVHNIAATNVESVNLIIDYYNVVTVTSVVNDADDFVVLPVIATVRIGHEIKIFCNAGSNFELRTPSTSNTTINALDCDGTKEYLCTDTEIVTLTKATATGWVATGQSALGAIVTAVVPD